MFKTVCSGFRSFRARSVDITSASKGLLPLHTYVEVEKLHMKLHTDTQTDICGWSTCFAAQNLNGFLRQKTTA
jgi:hypothetical protein